LKQIPGTNKVCKLETNIDDSTGEVLGHVMELLMSHGAKDVHDGGDVHDVYVHHINNPYHDHDYHVLIQH
jgi:hypothetical protein